MTAHSSEPNKEPNSPFKVGDKVYVVDEPYWQCPFNWVDEMTELCGQEVTITQVVWSSSKKEYLYRVAESRIRLAWCRNCFTQFEEDILETDEDITSLLS